MCAIAVVGVSIVACELYRERQQKWSETQEYRKSDKEEETLDSAVTEEWIDQEKKRLIQRLQQLEELELKNSWTEVN